MSLGGRHPFTGEADDPSPLLASTLFGAVQVEDFQRVPVLTARRSPRVSLLLADDVGLGKTVEAGLILTELLIRRRIRRVLILSPVSLRHQWQEEFDANPWGTFLRIIASSHTMSCRSACRRSRGGLQ